MANTFEHIKKSGPEVENQIISTSLVHPTY